MAINIIYMASPSTINIKHIGGYFFRRISLGFKHNHNEPYRHWRQDDGWHPLSHNGVIKWNAMIPISLSLRSVDFSNFGAILT